MPELPDIEVFTRNLKKLFGGKTLSKIKIVHNKNIKDSQKALSAALEGQKLKDIYRSGKEMRFLFSNGRILGLHLMLTGDLVPFGDSNERKSTKVEFYFRDGNNLALTDRFKAAFVKLDPEDKEGIDALDPKMNYRYLKKALNRKAAIKNVLLDQNVIRGIGNAYSDEILWQTGISPFSKADAIPDEKINELAKTIKKVLKKATIQIYKTHPGIIHGEIRDFLDIHTKKKDKSPTGAKIKMAERGMLNTFYTDEQVLY
ncbi:MAG TPA: DNA-formamidopyrimidine glycosylase family protein [Flavisolibacter sp.]|nr:DNA-formamidopyrimidine glycosylase family protein [Flavisolibacter sp.]